MTVAEFIKQLQQLPQDMEVRTLYYSSDRGETFYNVPRIYKGTNYKHGTTEGDAYTMVKTNSCDGMFAKEELEIFECVFIG